MKSQPWSNKIKAEERLPIRANSPFHFTHSPRNWERYEFKLQPNDKRKKAESIHLLLPSFSTLRLTMGVNGVRGGARPDAGLAISNLKDKGMKILDAADYDYLRMYPARGGSYYSDKWTTVQVLGRDVIFDFNHEGFADFRRKLILDGKIDLPHKHFIQLLKIRKQRAIDRIAQDQHIPERAIQLRARQAEIRAIIEFETRLNKLGIDAYDLQI
jgi:hypothetical protein